MAAETPYDRARNRTENSHLAMLLYTNRACPLTTTGVLDHMNTKMILAAIALSLSLAACAKKEEAAAPAADAAPAAEAPAAEAPAEATPPADAAPTEGAPAGDAAAPAETPAQ